MKYLSVFVLKREPDSVLEPDQWFEAKISMILVIDSVGKPLGHPNKIRVTLQNFLGFPKVAFR